MTKAKWIKAKFKMVCCHCHDTVDARDSILWNSELKQAMCKTCGDKFWKWIGGAL